MMLTACRLLRVLVVGLLNDRTGTSSPASLGGPADLDTFCCEAAANQSAVIR